MSIETLARCAREAEAALQALSVAASKVSGVRLKLARSIELMSVLARRAESGLDTFDDAELLSRAMAGGLDVSMAVSAKPRDPGSSSIDADQEKKIRLALASENGRKGGSQRTPKQIAAAKAAFAKRSANIAMRRAAKNSKSS